MIYFHEISQNERDIARIKPNSQTLENDAGNENLEKIRLEFLNYRIKLRKY